MKTTNKRASIEFKYSYWIYILTCLLVISIPVYIMSQDSLTGDLKIYNVASKLVQMFIFSSLAWIIGKRFCLNYIWVCALGGLGFILPQFLEGIFNILFRGKYLDEFSSPGFIIIGPIIGAFVIGCVILIISYPFQGLLLRNAKLSKLD